VPCSFTFHAFLPVKNKNISQADKQEKCRRTAGEKAQHKKPNLKLIVIY
jgi:hypothetical protein